MTKLEEIARAIYAKGTFPELGGSDNTGFWRISDTKAMELARAAVEAMRDYSETMSQLGGGVGKYGTIPVSANNPPVGQSIAERAYLAMIDCVLNETPGGGE